MKREELKSFLDALRADPKAEELIRNIPEPENSEGRIQAYAKIAKELGYDVSENDLTEYIAAKEKLLQEKTAAAAEAMQELASEELSQVAGGKDHSNCKDTFKDKENCWVNDACDIINHHYKGYQCHYNSECSHQNFTCGDQWYAECGSYYYYKG